MRAGGSGTALLPCRAHQIRAGAVDDLALRLVADVLTDPEGILELADAAEQQYATATTDAALAEATLAAYTKRLADLAAEHDKLTTALRALSSVPGMEEEIAGIRARLEKLTEEREEAEDQRTQVSPRRDRAVERQDFLRNLFTVEHSWFDFATGKTGGPSRLHIGWRGGHLEPDG